MGGQPLFFLFFFGGAALSPRRSVDFVFFQVTTVRLRFPSAVGLPAKGLDSPFGPCVFVRLEVK